MTRQKIEASARWHIVDSDSHAIEWDTVGDPSLPHNDHLEMSGQLVSVVVEYAVDANRRSEIVRKVYWPTLRENLKDFRGYLRHSFTDNCLPRIFDGYSLRTSLSSIPVQSIEFNGILTIIHEPHGGLQLTRQIFPSMMAPAVIEYCTVRSVGDASLTISLLPAEQPANVSPFIVGIAIDNIADVVLDPGQATSFGMIYFAVRSGDNLGQIDPSSELSKRKHWIAGINASLQLETPDAVIDRMFALAKVRSADSVFQTKMGLVHSPGGQRYYGGIWANDEAEYSGPFFPFLGDASANHAALTAYRIFATAMNPQYSPLPYAFEVEGDRPMQGTDRGDAAMIAYGASRFALAYGDRAVGEELWTLIEWCLEYCRRKLTPDGIVASMTDELEGRFPTGDANLSTSTLCYGGLIGAAALAKTLGKPTSLCEGYLNQAAKLREAIARCFHATVDGYETYQYFQGNTILRAWICLPLTMGILDRAPGTIAALFSPSLWTPDGVATQAGDKTFWDRATLYALRGVFAAGATEEAMQHLHVYSRRRLLGDHVPYAVEAYPEGNQAHLSAESALYCRVITEGLFGIVPVGFSEFTCKPRLPSDWPGMTLRNIRAFQRTFDLSVRRMNERLIIEVTANQKLVLSKSLQDGESVQITLL